jgi:hypothetical protein
MITTISDGATSRTSDNIATPTMAPMPSACRPDVAAPVHPSRPFVQRVKRLVMSAMTTSTIRQVAIRISAVTEPLLHSSE